MVEAQSPLWPVVYGAIAADLMAITDNEAPADASFRR